MNRYPHRYHTYYGSLFISQSESFEFAELQIADLIANSARRVEEIFLVFDVVASTRQVQGAFAHHVGLRILNYIDQNYPSLGARIVGITDNPRLRPGRDKVLRGSHRVDNAHQFLLLGDDGDIFPHAGREH
jgi:hypothetical protein